MTDFDILITTHSEDPLFLEAVVNFLESKGYTISYEQSEKRDAYWVWLPIIGSHMYTTEIAYFRDTFNYRDVFILPILLNDIFSPPSLRESIAIDVALDKDFQIYFDEIDTRLTKAQHIYKKLKRLYVEVNELETAHQGNPTPQMRTYLDDLLTHRNLLRRMLRQSSILHDSNKRKMQTGINELLWRYHQKPEAGKVRTIGRAPQSDSSHFKGREIELASIMNHVMADDDSRLISILGDGGVGKTALACNALETLSHNISVHCILYLNAEERNQQFSLEQLFIMTGNAFNNQIRSILDRVWNNEKMTLEARIDYLIDQYVENRCLILIDNLEDRLDADGLFVDDEFAQFIIQFLTRDHPSRIIVTSRQAIQLDERYINHIRTIPLSDGLDSKSAIELLYEFDENGRWGFQELTQDQMIKIVDMTKGYPRALQAIAGLFVNDPHITIEKLLITDITQKDDIVRYWVECAESLLDSDQRMVMQILSIFTYPVHETAIRYLLDPYIELTGIDVAFTLDKLRRGRYITINTITENISIHPLDRDYNFNLLIKGDEALGRMSAGERYLLSMDVLPPLIEESGSVIFAQSILEKRAGDFYAELRGEIRDWKTIHDLEPYFLEYDHRIRAKDYEACFQMLLKVYNLLKLSGFANKLVDLIKPLLPHLSDIYLMTCYNMLGMAYDDLGHYTDALDCHQMALPLAQQEQNRPAEAAQLSGIGLQYSNLGKYHKAMQHYEQALAISREIKNRKQERGILNNIAVVYNSMGRKLEALSYYDQSLTIAREIDDKQGAAVTLANIGDSYGTCGNIELAIEQYQESIKIYTDIGDKIGRGISIGKMGNVALMLGNYKESEQLLHSAIDIAQVVGNQMWGVLHQADLAAVYIHQNKLQESLDLLNLIIPHAHAIGNPIVINYTYSLLAIVLLYRHELDEALKASEVALEHVSPASRHYEYVIYGLILARLNRNKEAQEAFNITLDYAAELLDNTPNLYGPKYSRGLALMGLATVTDDTSYIEDAQFAYQSARDNCEAKGVIAREMRKLRALTDDGVDGNFDKSHYSPKS